MQVCKPGSVLRFLEVLAIYLDLDSHQDSIDLPTPESSPEEKESNEQLFARGLFDLSTHKVCRAPFITVGAVGSYPTFSPFPFVPIAIGIRVVYFLWHFLSPDRHQSKAFLLGSMALYVARTFLPVPIAIGIEATRRLAHCKVREFESKDWISLFF